MFSIKGPLFLKEIQENSFFSKFTVEQQGLIFGFSGILNLLHSDYVKARINFLKAINMFNSHGLFLCIKFNCFSHLFPKASMFHNVALLNLWSLKDPNEETIKIHEELKKIEGKTMKQLNEEHAIKSEKLLQSKIHEEDIREIISNFLYGLSFEIGGLFNMTKAVLYNEYNGRGIDTLLSLGEILLSFNEKSYKEVIL